MLEHFRLYFASMEAEEPQRLLRSGSRANLNILFFYSRQACSSLEGGLLCKPHFTQSQGASTVEGCYDSMVMLEKLSKQKGWFTSQPSWLAGEVQGKLSTRNK